MATFQADIERAVAIELRDKAATLYATLLPIYLEASSWTLNGIDPDLPAPFDVKIQLDSYQALILDRLKLTEWVTLLRTAQSGDTLTYPPPPDYGGGTGLADGSSLADGTETAQ
jgi:hypothetical protein